MLKPEDEEWTVPKLCQLLGKHISALKMVTGTEFSQATMHSDSTKQASQSENHKRNHQARPTTSELLSGQEKPTPGHRITQIKCVYCSQSH